MPIQTWSPTAGLCAGPMRSRGGSPKSLGNLLATVCQDFVAFTRQFDDVWFATSARLPKSLHGRKSATLRAGTDSLRVSGRVRSPLPLGRGEVARVFFAQVSMSGQHQPFK